jgi:hypothetical protein
LTFINVSLHWLDLAFFFFIIHHTNSLESSSRHTKPPKMCAALI